MDGGFQSIAFQPAFQQVVSASQSSGGWDFWAWADRHRAERDRRRRREREIEEETRDIEEAQAREIARLLRQQEEKDAERAELARLQSLADSYAGKRMDLPRKVSVALINAQEARTYAALMQLQREIAQLLEEEEALLTLLLLDE